MTIKPRILPLLVCMATISALVGCGGGSSSVTTTPPPAISVAFSSAPPTSLQTSATSPVTALVTNDSSNAGVDWSATCGGAACGSFAPTHTASGSATTYTAPTAVPSGSTVKITATSTTDQTKSISANISITATPPPISVSFSPAPPTTMQTTANSPFTAIVKNDLVDAGVDWTVTCGSVGACGTFAPAHTASGSASTYTAPSAVPSGGKVTVTATSTADKTKSISAAVTITVPAIAVSFNPAPPTSVDVSSNNPLTAVVANDPSNAGVDWTVTCGSAGACGSFNAAHTASGSATTYTAPPSVPSGGSVTVTATSTADKTKTASANIAITAPIVFFDPQPTPFLLVNDVSSITAVVTNDPQNQGVDWSCAPIGACGSLNPAHTASGSPTSYTAPASAGTVTITASSTADPLKTNKVTISVATQFGNPALNGNYVFEASGRDAFAKVTPGAYQVAGVLQANGSGNITGGELIYEDQPNNGNALDSINSGSYSIGTDGRGIITLTTGDTSIGVNGVLTLSVAMFSGVQGRITQFDTSATSNGTLDLQTPFSINPLSGGYAFVTNGVDLANIAPLGMGGVLNVSSGTVSVSGSVMDANDNGTVTLNAALTQAGSAAAPDQMGKVVINVSPTFPSSPSLTLVGFIVDDTHMKLIERDHGFGITAGTAIAQGKATGSFTANASFSGTMVFATSGFSQNTPVPSVYAGQFTADGGGNLKNGYADENLGGATTFNDTLTGTYTVDSTGTGRVQANTTYGSHGAGPSLDFYLTGNLTTPALILQVDNTPMETVGVAYTQAPGPPGVSSFSGSYGIGFTAFPSGGEDDGTGQLNADGTGAFSGNGDINISPFTPTPNVGMAGTFTASSTPGRFTGTLTASSVFSTSPLAFYIVDGTRLVFIETDTQPSMGVLRQQLSSGPPVISVFFNPTPPPSVQISSMTALTAVVANDPTNAGVDWTCAPVGACGSFTPTHTASGSATTYTAPATVPTGGTVTVTATSTADKTKSASAIISITLAAITVSFNPAPPTSVVINSMTAITAVTNDSLGVNWTVTCGSANCGSFNPTQTLSGSPTTYTAPSTIPSGGTVTVTATSVTDPAVNASVGINITGSTSVTVAFDPQPTPFLLINAASPVTAVVANDSQNLGVDWSVNCNGSACGSFNPAHTASGSPTVYTAPSTLPSGSTVVITASSTANPSKTARVTTTIATAFNNAVLNGNYVFGASGIDKFAHVAPSVYEVAGVLQADGNGNITGGELLYEDQPGNGNALDPIGPGTYSIGADGRGTITLTTSDTSIGVNGVLTFSVAMLSGTQGRVTQFDATASSRGALDLQTPFSINPLAGGYAFVTHGVDTANEAPIGVGGILNVSSPGTISVSGSVVDANDNGTVTTAAALTQPGSVAAPDQFGKVVINVSPALSANPALTFVGFIVDDTHVKLIERDRILGITSGTAFAQGATTGTFTTNNKFAGTFVYSTEGFSTVGTNPLLPTVYAGLFTADGSGDITNGYTDLNQFGMVIDDTLTGQYAVDSSGTGRVTTNAMFYGSNGEGPAWILYLTGNSKVPALILQVNASPFIETVGAVYTQAAGPFTASSFRGAYGLNFTAFLPSGGEDDGTGQITADGVGTLSPGTVDFNVCNFSNSLCPSFSPTPGVSLNGTFSANADGRFIGTLTDGDGTIFDVDPIVFYIIDSTRVLFIDAGAQPALGVFEQQLQ